LVTLCPMIVGVTNQKRYSCRVLSLWSEPRINLYAAIIEDPAHVSVHFYRVNNLSENTQGQQVFYFVDHLCPAAVRLKCVRVPPSFVWAVCLLVDKRMRTIPLADFCPPVKGYPVQAQMITNCGSLLN